ncbi:unnamed protein product, partial [Prorocentrum cordatum]
RGGGAGGPAASADRVGEWDRVVEDVLALWPSGSPRAVLCFAGGALAGAAPHVAYGRLLRQLAARGFLVLAVSYSTDLDYVAVADFVELRFERAIGALGLFGLPVWGLGHSLGALAQVLASSRHPVSYRQGHLILIAYTRRGDEALPVVRAALRANPLLGPLLRALDVPAASDLLMQGSKFAERALRAAGVSGPVQDLLPVAKQLLPLLKEVGADGEDSHRPRRPPLVRHPQRLSREANAAAEAGRRLAGRVGRARRRAGLAAGRQARGAGPAGGPWPAPAAPAARPRRRPRRHRRRGRGAHAARDARGRRRRGPAPPGARRLGGGGREAGGDRGRHRPVLVAGWRPCG